MKSNNELRKNPYWQPDQRVSNKKKQQADWYIPNANYLIDLAISNNDKALTARFLDCANGKVDPHTYEYVLANYTQKLGDKFKLHGEIRDVDFLTPIKERYMGEFINHFPNYQVFMDDPSIVFMRNKHVAEKMEMYANQEIINRLNSRGFDTNAPSIPQKDIKDVLEEVLEEWKDDTLISLKDRLDLINSIINAKDVYLQAYFHWWACEECYTYREVYKGDIRVININPEEYYRIDSGNRLVEDDDAGVRIYKMSIPQIIDRFRDDLKPSEIDYLKTLYKTRNRVDTSLSFQLIQKLDDFAERDKLLKNGQRNLESNSYWFNNQVDVFHYVWKTEVKQGILLRNNLIGIAEEIIVDSNYKFDASAGDIDLQWEYINQVWEGYRFGGAIDGIYIPPRPIEVQREHFNNYSNCKLPYNGIVGLVKHNDRNPIPYRINPYLALHRIFTKVQEQWASKFKSWLLLPESVLADSDQLTTEERLAFANRDAILAYDDIDASQTTQQGIREIVTNGVIQFVGTLEELKRNIKDEAWELANMNNARFGDTKDYAGKAVTEYNYNQALTGSVWSLETFNIFREKDYEANIDYSQFAWIDGKEGSFIDPATNDLRTVSISPAKEFLRNLGVRIANNADVQKMLSDVQNIAFSASQNGQLRTAVAAALTRDMTRIKKLIDKALKADEDFQKELQSIQGENQMQIEQVISQREDQARQFEAQENQLDRQNELDKIQLKGQLDLEKERERWKVDTNRNGHVDQDEAAAARGGYSTAQVNQMKMQQEVNK